MEQYILVYAYTTEMGCTYIDAVPVDSPEHAARVLIEHGIYPSRACLLWGEIIVPSICSDDYKPDSRMDQEWVRLRQIEIEEGERREYERLKAKYEVGDKDA